MNKIRKISAAAGLFLAVSAAGAMAATVDVTYSSYARPSLATALADRDGFIGPRVVLAEDFETGFEACGTGNKQSCSSGTIATQVGTFTGYGATHTGGASQVEPKDQIVVKSGTKNAYGRYNVTPDGANWLDSNDREGIRWTFEAPGNLSFSKLAFLLTDLDDVGKIVFSISVNGAAPELRPAVAEAGDGRVHLVTMTFDQVVSSFDILMINGAGDGFGFDGARVALAAVPVPAAGLMLVAALGGLAALRRRAAAA